MFLTFSGWWGMSCVSEAASLLVEVLFVALVFVILLLSLN